jgi:hypothetical protein
MLELNAPPMKTSFCHWDEPQSLYAALRYHDRPWPWQGMFGPRLVVEVSDSKHPEQAAHVMSLGAWDRFLRNVHGWKPVGGEFRLGALRFTEGEARAFADGVDAGEFYRHFVTAH